MHRLGPVVLVAALLLVAGCTTGPGSSSTPTPETLATVTTTTGPSTTNGTPTTNRSTTNASTTEAWCDYDDEYYHERVTSVPPPEIPDTLTNESVAAFAEAFERARIYREYDADMRATIEMGVEANQVNHTDEGWFVHLSGGYTIYDCAGVADGKTSVQYFVNETAVYREPVPPLYRQPSPTPVDPRVNGTRVL